MSNRTKLLAIGGGIGALLLAGGAFFLLSGRSPGETLEEIPGFGGAFDETVCPLSGEKPAKEELVDRPAVAVKIENNAVAYPLSGLEDAEIVYEELVEGGITRFLAMFHCGDAADLGPTAAPVRWIRIFWCSTHRCSSPTRVGPPTS